MLVCKHPITTLGFLYMESAAQIHNWRLGYEQACSQLSAFVYGICCANSYTCASVMLVCKHPITTLGFLYMESAAQIHNWRLGYEQASLLTTLGFCILPLVWKMIL